MSPFVARSTNSLHRSDTAAIWGRADMPAVSLIRRD